MIAGRDWLCALLATLLTAPLALVVALFVLLAGGPPIFHADPRVGRASRPFRLLKFRSMAPGRSPALSCADDPRHRSWGRFLRRSRLDELPQLWQILSGRLALLGPRPESPRLLRLDLEEERRLLAYRPGFIDPDLGLARGEEELLRGRPDPEAWYREHLRPEKARRGLRFVENRSLGGDIRAFGRALRALLRRSEARS